MMKKAVEMVTIDVDKLRSELKKRKISQTEFSRQLGKNDYYIAHLERTAAQSAAMEKIMCLLLELKPGSLIKQEEKAAAPVRDADTAPVLKREDMEKFTKFFQHHMEKLTKMVEEANDSIGVVRGKVNANTIQIEGIKKSMQDTATTVQAHVDNLTEILDGAVITKESTNITEAKQFLAEMMEGDGCEENKIYMEAQRRQIRKKDVQRAKNELGIITSVKGYGNQMKKIWIYG